MRKKVGTALDATLYDLVKEAAHRRGVTTNTIIEEALTRYLSGVSSGASTVAETRGTYKVSRKVLRLVLEEDLYGPG